MTLAGNVGNRAQGAEIFKGVRLRKLSGGKFSG